MSKKMSMWKWVILLLLSVSLGCAGKVTYQLPPMAERAVPDLQLDERPGLTINDEEAAALQKFSPVITGKIMKFVLAVEGYEDIADDVVKGYREFILTIFSDEKANRKRTAEAKKP